MIPQTKAWVEWRNKVELVEEISRADAIYSRYDNVLAIYPAVKDGRIEQVKTGIHTGRWLYFSPSGEIIKARLYIYDPRMVLEWQKPLIWGPVKKAMEDFSGKKLFDATTRPGLFVPLAVYWTLVPEELALIEWPT